MQILIAIVALLTCFVSISIAEQGAVGTRLAGVGIHEGYQTEVYGRFLSEKYFMGEVAFGVGYLGGYTIKGVPTKDLEQYPLTGTLALRLPIERGAIYIGGGGSFIPSQYRATYGSPVFQVGAEIAIFNKTYISADYRYQFNDPTGFWFGGVGFRF